MARISVQCPSCGFLGKASEENIGKRARCRQCGKSFTVGAAASVSPAATEELAAQPSFDPDLAKLAQDEIEEQEFRERVDQLAEELAETHEPKRHPLPITPPGDESLIAQSSSVSVRENIVAAFILVCAFGVCAGAFVLLTGRSGEKAASDSPTKSGAASGEKLASVKDTKVETERERAAQPPPGASQETLNSLRQEMATFKNAGKREGQAIIDKVRNLPEWKAIGRGCGTLFPREGGVSAEDLLALQEWCAKQAKISFEEAGRLRLYQIVRLMEKANLDLSQAPDKAEAAQRNEDEWIKAGSPVQTGDTVVTVASVKVQRVAAVKHGEDVTTLHDCLVIYVGIANRSSTRHLRYESWGDTSPRRRHAPSLTDDLGNSYKILAPPVGVEYLGQLKAVSLAPKTGRADYMVFEVPTERLSYLRLKLPTSAFGGNETLRFQIPKSMIGRLD